MPKYLAGAAFAALLALAAGAWTSPAAAAQSAKANVSTADVAALTEFSDHRRRYRHRHHVYRRHYQPYSYYRPYRSYAYYGPRSYYYGPRYYAPTPFPFFPFFGW